MFIETLEFTIPADMCSVFSTLQKGTVSDVELPASVSSYGTTQDANIQIFLRSNKLTFRIDGVSSNASIISKSECRTLKLSVFDVDKSLMPQETSTESDYYTNPVISNPAKRLHDQSVPPHIQAKRKRDSNMSANGTNRMHRNKHRPSISTPSNITENSSSASTTDDHNPLVKTEPEEIDCIEIEADPLPNKEEYIDYATEISNVPSTHSSSSSQNTYRNVPHVQEYSEAGPSRVSADQNADDFLVFQDDDEGGEADNDEAILKVTFPESYPAVDVPAKSKPPVDDQPESLPEDTSTTMIHCKYCSKTFKSKMSMKVHTRSHTQKYPFKCRYWHCTKGFNTRIALKEHVVAKHERAPFATCKVCQKTLTSHSAMKRHNATHHQPKFVCKICNKRFHTQNSMDVHEKGHLEKTATCEHCNKKMHEHRLAKHLREVHGPKLFRCTKCEFSTSRKGDLKRHNIVHVDVREKMCRHACGKAFKWTASLKKHEKKCKGPIDHCEHWMNEFEVTEVHSSLLEKN